jgi:hypothetical protein
MSEIEHQGTVAMRKPVRISSELLGKIVDDVFDGAIEDASVIEDIYAAIKRHEDPAPQDRSRGSELLTTIKEFARWHHLNELTIAAGKTPSDSEIDFEAIAWSRIERALAASEGER